MKMRTELQADSKRSRHSVATIYTVWLLWLFGFTESKIGQALNLRKGQVSGIINQSDYRNRADMTHDQRQKEFDDLLLKRFDQNGYPIDGGLFRTLPEKILPLNGRGGR